MARPQARSVAALSLALCGILLPIAGGAQGGRVPDPNAPRLMIGTFRNPDKKLGPDAAEAVRTRIGDDMSLRQLWVIPTSDILGNLDASGYSTTDALPLADAAALGKLLRADIMMDGAVTKTATGFQLEATVVLVRDVSVSQPLGTFDGKNLGASAQQLSKAFQDAYKQLAFEKKCTQAARDGKPADALVAATAGIAAYPKTTMVRICLMNVLIADKKPPEEVLKVISEILALDPRSKPALSASVLQYDAAGNAEKKIEALTQLLAADPTNAKLQGQVVSELAASGKADLAKPIIEKAVADSPGDLSLVKLYWLILGASKDYKKMVLVGEEMVKMDTASADQPFFDKLIAAYAADSQYAKAADAASRATVKFPQVAALWVTRGNVERRAGQAAQSLESLKKALTIDPKVEGARMAIINSYVEQNQLDSALTGMREAAKAGEQPNLIGTFAITVGNRLYKAAAVSKEIADYQKAMPYLELADSVSKDIPTRTNAKFLIGVSAFSIGQIAATEAPKTKSCELAKLAQDALVTAQINLPAGGAIAPDATKQLLGALPSFLPAVDAQVKAFCPK